LFLPGKFAKTRNINIYISNELKLPPLWKSPMLIYEAPPKEPLKRLAPPKPKLKPDKTLEFSLKSSHIWAFVHTPHPLFEGGRKERIFD
jgi:hypothetical protein